MSIQLNNTVLQKFQLINNSMNQQTLSKVHKNPLLFQKLTYSFLSQLSPIPNSTTISSQNIQTLLKQLYSSATQQQGIEQQQNELGLFKSQLNYLILFNAVKLVMENTFKDLRNNKIMNGLQMIHGVYMQRVVRSVLNLQQIEGQDQLASLSKLKYIAFGLAATRILVNIAENKRKQQPSCFPQMYRFLLLVLRTVSQIMPKSQSSFSVVNIYTKKIQQNNKSQDTLNKQFQNISFPAQEKKQQNIQKEQLLQKYRFSAKQVNNESEQKRKESLNIEQFLCCFNKMVKQKYDIGLICSIILKEVVDMLEYLIDFMSKIYVKSWKIGIFTDFYNELIQIRQRIQGKNIKRRNYIDIYLGSGKNNKTKDKALKQKKNKSANQDLQKYVCLKIDIFQLLNQYFSKKQIIKLSTVIKNTKNDEKEIENIEQVMDQEQGIFFGKQLTPRMYDEQPAAKLNKLRTQKKKLQKKIQNDIRMSTYNKVLENKVRSNVRDERAKRVEKKQKFVMDKQAQQAKKFHNKMKAIKKRDKESKNGGKMKGKNKR